MPFYIMKQDTMIEGVAAVDSVPDNIDSFEWVQGKNMPAPNEDETLILDLALESGDFRGDIIDGLITLYHNELKKSLEKLGVDNIKYFPVRLRDQSTGETEGGYSIANIIGLIDCVDLEKSKLNYWPSGRGFDFESMVIDESKTNGAKIFRLESDPSKVIINEELKQYFDKTDSLVGVELIQTEDYSDW
ncbi:imm11 family protein [Colwellia echini]|uniref:Immunity MXAN-0049 protein domain-containing protein n=1 Tax=Colwellia echini TaxID=1982103 RepID=A0ABY3MTI0_9GAMM|nr:DUF1629 domain-containing protein [Colwellia echini]TYK64489.1 hypothetical protein CWS31_015410 [Colwellia echini]